MKITKSRLIEMVVEEYEKIIQEDATLVLEEGWKENIIAAAIAASSMLGGQKAKAQDIKGTAIQKQDSTSIKIPIGTSFESGRYLLGDKEEVKDILKQVGAFMKKFPNSNIQVDIQSGESQVPNYDAEVEGKPKLKPGQLAQKRSETAKFMINSFVDKMKKEGIFKGNVSIQIAPATMGKTKYTPGDDARDPKFEKEQFVNLVISAKGGSSKPSADFSAYAKAGESMFDESGKLIGIIYYKTRQTDDITKGGAQNTGQQNVLFKSVDDAGKETGKNYLVPKDWFNKNIHGNYLSKQLLSKIQNQDFGKESLANN